MLPARVSHSRRRYPLRVLVRSSLRAPNSAPHTASASAPINACTNVADHLPQQIRRRLRQLLGQPTGQVNTGWCGHRADSSSRVPWSELVEDHAVAVSHHDATHTTAKIKHHVRGRNSIGGRSDPQRQPAPSWPVDRPGGRCSRDRCASCGPSSRECAGTRPSPFHPGVHVIGALLGVPVRGPDRVVDVDECDL